MWGIYEKSRCVGCRIGNVVHWGSVIGVSNGNVFLVSLVSVVVFEPMGDGIGVGVGMGGIGLGIWLLLTSRLED